MPAHDEDIRSTDLRIILRIGEQGVENEMRRGIDGAGKLGLAHERGLGEEAPEMRVHGAGEGGDVDAGACSRELVQDLKKRCHPSGGPGVNLGLLAGELGIGQSRLLPRAISAEIAQIVGKRARQNSVQGRANVCGGLRAEIEAAEIFEQFVHQREEQLALRAVVLIESSDSEFGSAANLFNGSGLETLFGE